VVNSAYLLQTDSISYNGIKNFRKNKKLFIVPEFHGLHTTHGSNFSGKSIILNYQYSKTFYFGLGAEFSLATFHGDNGWNLHNLKFIPVFLDFKLSVTKNKLLVPFFHTSEGISFNNYKKEADNYNGKSYNVSEKGLYVYAGIGVLFKIRKYLKPIIDIGFKGYHMSFNNLDVNPHGLTFRFGLMF